MENAYLLFWSTAHLEEAKAVAKKLVEQKMAGCCSIIDRVHSIYRWEEKIEEQSEVKVLIKTTKKHVKGIQKVIQAEASYEVAELLAVKVDGCAPDYLNWLLSVT